MAENAGQFSFFISGSSETFCFTAVFVAIILIIYKRKADLMLGSEQHSAHSVHFAVSTSEIAYPPFYRSISYLFLHTISLAAVTAGKPRWAWLIWCWCVLQWELFCLPDLESYDAMLARIFKQELERIVSRYESYRTALLREMERRKSVHWLLPYVQPELCSQPK